MTNFDHAVARLNSRNLPFLWRLCGYLSSLEMFGRQDSPIFPLWNCEMARLLCDAVLTSSAAPYKTGTLRFEDLRFVINSANEALNDPRLQQEVQSGGDRPEMLYQLIRFFARMANVQLRQQEPWLLMTAGQLVAMFTTIPRESLNEFAVHDRDLVSSMPDEIEAVLQGRVFDYFLIHQSIQVRYKRIAKRAFESLGQLTPPKSRKMERRDERQVRVFEQLAAFLPGLDGDLTFTAEDLCEITPKVVSKESIGSYLSFFARNTPSLRELGLKKEYQHGPVGWQLSPLERFPVVDLADGNLYCVPNVRTFVRSFADVIHFTLQSKLGDRYNRFRGASQEVFLQQLVREKLSLRRLIPERPYKKVAGEVRGPDLTLVEEPDPSLILVESKGKRILAETRFTMSDESFDENNELAFAALQRLPSKVADLRGGLAEYSDVQSDLDATRDGSPFAVVVLGEAVYEMTRLLRYRAETEPTHPLHGYLLPFAVMSPQIFELAVEHASQEVRPLRQVLLEFWEDSGRLEMTDPSPEIFRGKQLREGATFAASFLKAPLKDAGLAVE